MEYVKQADEHVPSGRFIEKNIWIREDKTKKKN